MPEQVKMVPLLLLQMLYKSIWVIAVALPLWSTFRSIELTRIMGMGAVVDLIVIPWPYVFENYVKAIFRRKAKDESLSPLRSSTAK